MSNIPNNKNQSGSLSKSSSEATEGLIPKDVCLICSNPLVKELPEEDLTHE